MTTILGISAFYHDSAASIIQDGKIIAADKKKDLLEFSPPPPPQKIQLIFLLDFTNKSLRDIDHVVF